MSGPIGSPYPGNFVAVVLACMCFFAAIKFARSAYRRRQLTNDNSPSWESSAGMAVLALGGLVFFLSAVWAHR